MKAMNSNDPFNLQQVYASAFQGFGPPREIVQQYWRNQDRLLGSAEEFARGWFARRRDACQSAIEQGCRMCDSRSPAEAVQQWQSWMRGSMERMAADALGLQKHMMTVAELASRSPLTEMQNASRGDSHAPESRRAA
ncbi:MAG: hypothetical protein IT190_09400 [Microbacteriaceae bacterium]|nr:hypothetical protein [Microbacteriaceae bacterium]